MAKNRKSSTEPKAVIDNPLAANLRNFLETIAIELPSAAVKSASDSSKENKTKVEAAGWKAYDAAVALMSSATNALYTSESFGEFGRAALEAAVQFQRLQASMTGAFFASLWPAIGLPTSDDIESLHAQVRSLRADLVQARAEREAGAENLADRFTIIRDAMIPEPARQINVWTGWNFANQNERDDVGN